jgi:hypothetical protein
LAGGGGGGGGGGGVFVFVRSALSGFNDVLIKDQHI